MTRSRLRLAGAIATSLAVLAVTLAAIALAAAPTATTGDAGAVTTSSATISGTVDPGGVATTYTVEYGTTTAYGTTTDPVAAGSGTEPVPVTVGLSGLTAGTGYHYRLVATNADGTTVGADRTFTTTAAAPAAPTATTGAASSVSATGARLSASVNARGSATSVVFDIGTTTAYGATSTAVSAGNGTTAITVNRVVGGLAPRTTYNYRVRATSAAGTALGANRTFTTSAAPRPSIGSDRVTNVMPTTATMTARVDPNGRPTEAYVEFGIGNFARRTPSVSVGAGTAAVPLSFALTGLTPRRAHQARVVAVSDGGTRRGSTRRFTPPRVPAVATLTVSPNPVPYGRSAQVSGTLAGTGAGGAAVELHGSLHPFASPFTVLRSDRTSNAGAFAFTVAPRGAVRLFARGAVGGQRPVSAVTRLNVAPRVGLVTRAARGGRVRLSGTVVPRRNGTVSLRKRSPSGRWVTVKRTRTVPSGSRFRSRYAITIERPSRTAEYRIRVKTTNRALVAGESRVVRVKGRR
jgi:hypothetical protein